MAKIEIKKKECKLGRSKAFGKRHRGLTKKAYELSVLCGVDVALIMYSPSDVLRQFSSHPRLEKILQRFVHKMSENERENLQVSQDIIDRINLVAGPADVEDQIGPDAPKEEENNPEIVDLQEKLKLLKEQQKVLDPGVESFDSEQQIEEHIRRLERIRSFVANRRHQNESERSSRIPCSNPLQSVQNDHAQITLGPAMWDPVCGGEQLQWPGVQFVGNGDPLSSSNPAPLFNREQSIGVSPSMPDLVSLEVRSPYNFDTRGTLSRGHHEQVLQHGSIGDPCSSSFPVRNPLFIGQNTRQGMVIYGGVDQTVRQPSSASCSSLQIPMQNIKTELEAQMWDLLHGGEHARLPGFKFAGPDQDANYPPVLAGEQTASVSSSLANFARSEATELAGADMWIPPPIGHQEQLQHGTMQVPCSSASPTNNQSFNGEQNTMFGRIGSEATCSSNVSNILATPPRGWHQEGNTQQGMPSYNGAQSTARDLFSSIENLAWDEIFQTTESNGTTPQNNRTF